MKIVNYIKDMKIPDNESIVVICNTQKIDNIICCTMRIVESK